MSITEQQTILAILTAVSLFVFSRQILRLCLSLFVSVSSIILAVVSLVCCVLLIFFVAAPTVVITCYVVGQIANGKGTHSRVVEQVCDIRPPKSMSNRY
jgi:hypothetical protein